MATAAPTRWLVALKGYPGSGKSAVASALSRELHWPIVDKDDIQDTLDRPMEGWAGLLGRLSCRVSRMGRWLRPRYTSGHDGPRDEEDLR